MALNFDKLRERLAKVQGKLKTERDSVYWKPKDGEQTIRILETADGDPLVDFYFHYNLGKDSGFLCPSRNFGEDCPVCSFASKLWHEGSKEDKELAKTLFVRQRFFSIIVEKDEEGKLVSETPKIWGYSKKVYEDLMRYIEDQEDYGNITSFEKGHDIKLTYGKAPGAKFTNTVVKVRPHKSSICENMSKADCKKIAESMPNFLDHMTRKTTKEVEQILNNWSTSGAESSFDDSDEDVGTDYKETRTSEKKKKEEKKSSEKSESTNPVDKAFDDLLG